MVFNFESAKIELRDPKNSEEIFSCDVAEGEC